jgi:glutamate 5-kinase
MIKADFLFLLTDVDGLYTSNPRKDPEAKLIELVDSVSDIRSKGLSRPRPRPLSLSVVDENFTYSPNFVLVSTKTLGSSLGTGGMETKLIAADIATAAGVRTIIASSQNPKRVFDIVDWTTKQSSSNTPPTPRPVHTQFAPSPTPLRSLKAWTFHTLNPSGGVIIDSGAHAVLSRRDSGGRLLAAGVIGVKGTFASGQAVRILVRRISSSSPIEEHPPSVSVSGEFNSIPPTPTHLSRTPSIDFTPITIESPTTAATISDEELTEVGRGLTNYNSAEIDKIKGYKRFLSRLCNFFPSHHSPLSLARISLIYLVTSNRNTSWRPSLFVHLLNIL